MPAEKFLNTDSNLASYWRGLILFGRNSASYKFAFAKALLELKPSGGDLLKLEDIAPVYASSLVEHLRTTPKQNLASSSKFISACQLYGIDEPDSKKLIEETVKLGFGDVVKAFQVLGSDTIEKKFYIDEVKSHGGIRLTDNFSVLKESKQFDNLSTEVESRWSLVESAWELGVTKNIIAVNRDSDDNLFFNLDPSKNRRKNITSARGALNGYQKGKCFYCKEEMKVETGSHVHVDHFLPFKLSQYFGETINGIWNLVLACAQCNGPSGKWDKLPHSNFLQLLKNRNEYLILSHHPLRETLILQTGMNANKRNEYINDIYSKARAFLTGDWTPPK